MAKKASPLDIMNLMGDAADKKSRKPAPEGSPMEEANESPQEAAAEGDPLKKKKAPKPPKVPSLKK